MRAALLVAALAVSSCHPPKPPEPPPALDAPACMPEVTASLDDACEGYFTAEDVPCGVCRFGSGCLDRREGVYCARVGCAVDPACRYVPSFGVSP